MRSLKSFGLGTALALSALAVSFWTDSVWAQEQIAVYRVQPVQVTRDSVLKLAREAFGMTSPQVTEDDEVVMRSFKLIGLAAAEQTAVRPREARFTSLGSATISCYTNPRQQS